MQPERYTLLSSSFDSQNYTNCDDDVVVPLERGTNATSIENYYSKESSYLLQGVVVGDGSSLSSGQSCNSFSHQATKNCQSSRSAAIEVLEQDGSDLVPTMAIVRVNNSSITAQSQHYTSDAAAGQQLSQRHRIEMINAPSKTAAERTKIVYDEEGHEQPTKRTQSQ